MIKVTRVDGREQVLNAELIETVEDGGDTMLTLVGGQHIRVREPVEEIVDRVIEYKRRIHYLTLVADPGELDEEARRNFVEDRTTEGDSGAG